MQYANLNQTPGRHFLARGVSLQRAHKTSSIRPCAALDVRVPQATPQPKVEERKTYLGSVFPAHLQKEIRSLSHHVGLRFACIDLCRERFWQIQPSREGQQADYRDPHAKQTPPEICLKNLNHVALGAANPLDLTDFYTRVLGFNSISRPNFLFEGSWLEGAGLLVHIIQEDPSVPKGIHDWKVLVLLTVQWQACMAPLSVTHSELWRIEHVRKFIGLQEKYADKAPESWYIRRANHLGTPVCGECFLHFSLSFGSSKA